MLLLNGRSMYGKEMMKELKLKSPGTIYPVLDDLTAKGLIHFHVEISGSVRKKIYDLTPKGKKQLRASITSTAKLFCCDLSLYLDTIMRDARPMVDIKKHEKVYSTLDLVDMRGLTNGAEIVYPSTGRTGEKFDAVLTFTGINCLMGEKKVDIIAHLRSVRSLLRNNGRLLVVEIERTDNLFARIFFNDVSKLSKLPGTTVAELEMALISAGFDRPKVVSKSGLVYGLAIYDEGDR
ncbi:MAG: Transcriptional regulator PadR-like family protein [Methanomassiliicoccales archaeon PtaU1.Bin124]|nr:MAG: Transcriptional regulator PadR-like family protein [Methanomassiliicoccales archaeon PtaU1.Bin124]